MKGHALAVAGHGLSLKCIELGGGLSHGEEEMPDDIVAFGDADPSVRERAAACDLAEGQRAGCRRAPFLSAGALGVSLGSCIFPWQVRAGGTSIALRAFDWKKKGIHPSVAFSDRYSIVSTPDQVHSRYGHMAAELGRWADWVEVFLPDATMAKCLQYPSVPFSTGLLKPAEGWLSLFVFMGEVTLVSQFS